MVAVTEVSQLLQTKPATTGVKIGSGDWRLHVERLVGNEDGAEWDVDYWYPNGWADFPGTAGNYLSAPDAAPLDIVGDICIVARIAPDDWTTAAGLTIAAKWVNIGQLSWLFDVDAAGTLTLFWTADGSSPLAATSTAGLSALANGAWKWVAVTLDVDNGAAGKDVRFWSGDDGTAWSQLGATVTTAGTTSIKSGSDQVEIGSAAAGTLAPFAGLIQTVSIRNGIGAAGIVGGSQVFKFEGDTDYTDLEALTFTATTGQTVTVHRAGTPDTELVSDSWEWASLGWESLNNVLRGMEWTRGADQPNGRPRNGEIALTLLNEMDGANDPWVNYINVRPGTVLRAGITSATDSRAAGWVPLWAGIVESWTPQYVGARSSGYRADSFAEVRLIETLGWVARTDAHALGAPAGAGETIVPRVDRLLVDAEWPFGTVTLFDPDNPLLFTLQATSMTANRLAELYLTADSTGGIIRSDVTGACLITNKETDDWASRLAQFTYFDFFGVHAPMFVLADGDEISGTLWQFGYDPDTIQTVNDPEGIVNDHRYTRVGGTQQIFEHPVSIGQFGRITRARGDLICQTDPQALAIANDDNDHEALTALRIDNVEVVATARPNALLAVAAADHNDQIWIFPPAAAGFTGSAVGRIRSLSHSITPMQGKVHWTANYALDLYTFNNLPGAILPEA